MQTLSNKHSGPCYIIGKGPSLDSIGIKDFPISDAPIICLNQSISVIEQLDLPNPVYSLQRDVWKDSNFAVYPKKAKIISSKACEKIFKNCYIFDTELPDLSKAATAIVAIHIAKYMGCTKLIFLGFDSVTENDFTYASCFEPTKSHKFYEGLFTRIYENIRLYLGIMQLPAVFEGTNRVEVKVADYTIITPTGDRKFSLGLCRKFVSNQTVMPKQWLVVDDGKFPVKHTAGMDYVRREPQHRDPRHTLKANLLYIIDKIECNTILVFEDDDYYRSDYAETMLNNIGTYDLLYLDNILIYNVKYNMYQRYKEEGFHAFANFCFKKRILPKLHLSCQGHQANNDNTLLKLVENKKRIDLGSIFVGIKGISGRPGTSRPQLLRSLIKNKFIKDDRTVLKEALGEDYKYYANIKYIDFEIKQINGRIPGTRTIGNRIVMIRPSKKLENYLDSTCVKYRKGIWLDVALDKSP
jgi:hypothetical protein